MVIGAWRLDRRLAALGGGRGKMEMEGGIFWVKTRFEVSYSLEVGSAWLPVLGVVVSSNGQRCTWPAVGGFRSEVRGEQGFLKETKFFNNNEYKTIETMSNRKIKIHCHIYSKLKLTPTHTKKSRKTHG
jgi:hypothetical protein